MYACQTRNPYLHLRECRGVYSSYGSRMDRLLRFLFLDHHSIRLRRNHTTPLFAGMLAFINKVSPARIWTFSAVDGSTTGEHGSPPVRLYLSFLTPSRSLNAAAWAPGLLSVFIATPTLLLLPLRASSLSSFVFCVIIRHHYPPTMCMQTSLHLPPLPVAFTITVTRQ